MGVEMAEEDAVWGALPGEAERIAAMKHRRLPLLLSFGIRNEALVVRVEEGVICLVVVVNEALVHEDKGAGARVPLDSRKEEVSRDDGVLLLHVGLLPLALAPFQADALHIALHGTEGRRVCACATLHAQGQHFLLHKEGKDVLRHSSLTSSLSLMKPVSHGDLRHNSARELGVFDPSLPL